jgi:hypothetical protein
MVQLSLDDLGRTPVKEPIVRAGTGQMRLEIRRVPRELANGALEAPKRAAAIFTAAPGDVVPFADIGPQAHGNNATKQAHGELEESTRKASTAVTATSLCWVLTCIGILKRLVHSGIGAGTHNKLDAVNRNNKCKEDFKG